MNPRPTRALIDTRALRANLGVIQRQVGAGVAIIGVVKANCYGHDASICIPVLREGGIEIFAVATVEEAATLRSMGVDERIIVMAPPLDGQYDAFVALDAEPFVSNGHTAQRLSAAATSAGRTLACHLFVDTGMGRDGVPPADALRLLDSIRQLQGVRTVGFASHFATSDEVDNDWSHHQLRLFEAILREAQHAGHAFDLVHIANSGGVFNLPQSHFTAVRPGLSLYGFHPTQALHAASELRPVLGLRTVIGNITRFPAGAPISYGRRWWTERDTYIATLPIGYADGLFRNLTNRMSVLVGSKRRPQVGTVCMDEVMIDLGPDLDVAIGDEVIILGASGTEQIDAWELSELAGTIPYEVCTNLSARVPRVPVPHDPYASGVETTETRR